jgi:hypothetical protein
MQNFGTIRQSLLGGKREKRKEEKNLPKIVATFIYASSQGQRTRSAQTNSCLPKYSPLVARTSLGPKYQK